MGWIMLCLTIAFVVYGEKLSIDAARHLRDQRKTYYFTPLVTPEEYSEDGQWWRRRALIYWRLGGTALLALHVLIWIFL